MSKYLVKILAVCAFVVLLPLVVVASALSVTEVTACTLNLFTSVDAKSYTATSKVLINGEESTKINVMKNTEVELTFESEGYYFIGWYNGTKDTYKPESEPVSKNSRFTYSVVDTNANLTAVAIEKTYNITFVGNESKNGVYKYGQPLDPAPTENEAEARTFIGWSLASESGTFNSAIFSAASEDKYSAVDVTLEPVFSDEKLVTYYKANGEVAFTEHYNKDQFVNFELKTNEELSEYITKGYQLKGFKNNDDGTDFDDVTLAEMLNREFSTAALNIKIVEEAVTYTMDVKFHESSDKVVKLSYNVTESGVKGADQFTRDGYTFKGIKVGDTLFTKKGNDFVNADETSIVEAMMDGETEAVAVWECNYASINVRYTANAGTASDPIDVYKDGEEYPLFNVEFSIILNDSEQGIKLEDKVIETMLGNGTFKNENNKAVTLYSITIKEFGTTDAKVFFSNDYSEATFGQMFSVIPEEWQEMQIIFWFK